MIALYIIGGILLLFFLLCLLRVGAEIRFGAALSVKARVGPLKLQLLPKKEKTEKAEAAKQKPPKEKKPKAQKEPKPKKPRKTKPKLGYDEITAGAEAILPALHRALRHTRRSIRIDPFRLHVVFAGDDPAETAKIYAWAEAAMWAVMPEAERLLVLPHPHVKLDCDFQGDKLFAEGEVGLSVRIGSMMRVGLMILIPALKWFMKLPRVPVEPPAETPPADGAAVQEAPPEAEEKSA